jgi:hypothetical protein
VDGSLFSARFRQDEAAAFIRLMIGMVTNGTEELRTEIAPGF